MGLLLVRYCVLICFSFSNSWCHKQLSDLACVTQKQTCSSHTTLLSDFTELLIAFFFSHPQMRLFNPARWPAGSTTPCLTMGQSWRGGHLLHRSVLTWSHRDFTHTPKARTSGWMDSFAVPLARTASVMASRSAIDLYIFMRRFVSAY